MVFGPGRDTQKGHAEMMQRRPTRARNQRLIFDHWAPIGGRRGTTGGTEALRCMSPRLPDLTDLGRRVNGDAMEFLFDSACDEDPCRILNAGRSAVAAEGSEPTSRWPGGGLVTALEVDAGVTER
jgi:hypothetical protein